MVNKKKSIPPKEGERVILRGMEEVMHSSMIPYAEHVIMERALPRVEDGLKPVQRRILYTMLELGLTPDKPFRKSARIVGDCLGKYHPHGDSSVYDAMVRMAQSFNMSTPLVNGHGNFGSVDGDSAAAMRYTEARMTEAAMELLRDIDKDTVKFGLNFDDTLKEPEVLPGRFPNLLVNGSSGIAVGLATNIPPHNLVEGIDAVIAQLDDPEITVDELMAHIPCPDFPTGGFLLRSQEIRNAYSTGRGKLTLRARTSIEEQKNGRKLIAITELPYQTNKARLLEDILKLSQTKKELFSGISDIRDESDRTGMRAVIEVKKEADAERILQYLFKYSDLQTTFGVNMVAIVEGKPQQIGLKELIEHYILHQRDVVTRRTSYELDNAKKREHILSGLMIAIDNIDEVIAIIRASKTPKAARDSLMKRFELSEPQAQAILDLRLQRLTNLEMTSIKKEYREITKLIERLSCILATPKKLNGVIRDELTEIKGRFAAPRRTKLLDEQPVIDIPVIDLKSPEPVVISVLRDEKLRRIPKRLFNAEQTAAEKPMYVFDTYTDKRIRLFTNTGYCMSLCIEDIPESKPNSRPVSLASLIPTENGERVVSAFVGDTDGLLFFYTKNGMAKATKASEFKTKQKRIVAITLKDNDTLLGVEPESGDSIIMITRNGMSIRYPISAVAPTGRSAAGVKGIKLDQEDAVIFACQSQDAGEILVISDRGYMKRSFIFDYDLQNRHGKGLKTFDFKRNNSNGSEVAAAFYVREPFDVAIKKLHGEEIIINTDNVPIEPRASKGTPMVFTVLDDVIVEAHRRT